MTITTAPTVPDLLGTSPADLARLDASAPVATLDVAQKRAERIRAGLESYTRMRQDIADAYASRDWIALNYGSWFAYLEGEYGDELKRLTRDERPGAVADLREQGLSQRAIGAALGVSKRTVETDLAQVATSSHLPDSITGTDGKTYASKRPERPQSPGPVDTTTPPVGSGPTPAPVVDAPAPSREPDLTADVVRVLGGVPGVASELGLTVAEIWCKMPAGVPSVAVQAAVEELAEAGRVEPAGRVLRGNRMEPRWLLAEEAPEPGAVPSTAPSGSGPAEVASTREGGAASAPEPKPTLRIVPDAAEVLAAEQRDARALLRRVVEILAPAHDRPGFVETWARQLGPYDEELSELIHRAHDAMASLDDLISEAGK